MLSVGFTCSVRAERYSHKKGRCGAICSDSFFYANGGIANYRALTFRKQKSFGTFADKIEE